MTRRFKITGFIEFEQSEIDEAEGDPYMALPESIRLNLEDIEFEEVDEDGV